MSWIGGNRQRKCRFFSSGYCGPKHNTLRRTCAAHIAGISGRHMKLIRFDRPGPPDVLQCLDVPVPEPKAGEVLIRAHAIGVGMPDVMIRAGTYTHMPPLPATPGTELAGMIEKVGPGVTARQGGQRVYTP